MNDVAMEFILLCDTLKDNNDKAVCRDRLERIFKDKGGETYTNAQDFVKFVFKKVFEEGSCRDKDVDHFGLDKDTVRGLLGSWQIGEATRVLIPALLARMLRCDEDMDWPTFKHLKKLIDDRKIPTANCTSLGSAMLQYNIMYAEMYVSYSDI